jgi:hypothetical protein
MVILQKKEKLHSFLTKFFNLFVLLRYFIIEF